MTPKLDRLFQYLDQLQGQAPLDEVETLLGHLDVNADDLARFVRFSDSGYTRNAVRGGRWYQVWVLCWKNGQRSPIHDHRGSTCGVRILRGTATQTLFVHAPNGHIKAVCSDDFGPGSIVGSVDQDMHQVSNLQAGDADLVTLHVYSPPLTHMVTYNLTNRDRGEEVWSFVGGEGI